MTILEPCCKKTQFSKFLRELQKKREDTFIHYGDVNFTDWYTPLLLEAKGSDAYFRLNTLDINTLNYILNRMRDHAFIPGKELSLINKVSIQAKVLPEPLPQRAKLLIEEGRLTIKKMKRTPKYETSTLKLPEVTNGTLLYRMEGKFFAEQPNEARSVHIKRI